MSGKKIYKPRPVSGFPEWTPEVRMVEQHWLDHIRRVFESYGYCSIETPSVEELDVIQTKGGDGESDVDKEVYVIERLHKDEEDDKEARLALHFDQTVPLARYTAQHFNDLTFPFKRYQMQRVWRGERPQAGRFREFRQCDIDVINVDHLPLHFDAEMPAIIWEILSSLPGMEKENIQIRVSNRKILIGIMEYAGISDQTIITATLNLIDKIEKMPREVFSEELEKLHIDEVTLKTIQEFIKWAAHLKESAKAEPSMQIQIENLKLHIQNSEFYKNTTFAEGIDELISVMKDLKHLPEGAVVADLSIVRGLDYYTGTVYETVFTEDPEYGSICSGGRYDDLAGSYINKHLPGVGISIGFTRLFDRLRQQGKLPVKASSPAHVMMVVPSEERRGEAMKTAHTLRQRGLNVETAHGGKLKRQLAYAEKKAIPYVWFPPFEDGSPHEVKNMQTGAQTQADPENWRPDEQ